MTHIETVRRKLMSKLAECKDDRKQIMLERKLKALNTIEKRSYNAVFDCKPLKTSKYFN